MGSTSLVCSSRRAALDLNNFPPHARHDRHAHHVSEIAPEHAILNERGLWHMNAPLGKCGACAAIPKRAGATKALCEASKYFFWLQYESGSVYRPSTRDFELALKDVVPSEAERLSAIWTFWEKDDSETEAAPIEEEPHPDQAY